MTISVKCSCGKLLAAPDSLRGKKARCPGCGKPLLVRDELSDTPPQPPEGIRPATQGGHSAQAPGAQGDDDALSLNPDDLAAAGISPAHTSNNKCRNCQTVLTEGQTVCPACGFDSAANIYTRQKRTQDTTKSYGNFLGIEMSPVKLIALATVVVLIIGVVGWYYLMGPGRKFRVIQTQVVTGFDALDGISVLQPLSLGQLGGDGRLGMKLPEGVKVPGAQPAAGVIPGNAPDITGLGGSDKLTLTRPDPSGNYLLIRAEISQSFLQDNGFSSRYDLVFRSSAYTLQTTSNPAGIPGVLLAATLDSGSAINLEAAKTSDYHALYPSIYKPAHEDVKLEGNFPNTGDVVFVGGNAKGHFHFDCPNIVSPGASSLIATGKLDVTSPQGMSIAYEYKGGDMTVGWAPDVTGWRATGQYTQHEHFSPFHKWEITLLFPRPAGADSGQIMLNGKPLASISFPASTAGPAAIPTPGITVTAPPPPPENTTANAGGTTGGSSNSGGAGASKAPGGITINDPLTAYLSALANARNKAKGVVSGSNMQQLLYAILLYTQQHQGKMPDKLDDLRGTIDGYDTIIRNPRTQEIPGFIYKKPADNYDQINSPGYTPILYESDNGQADPNGDIGYADGHVTMGM